MANQLEELQADLASYKAARDSVLVGGQSYTVAGRSLSRGDLAFIERRIRELRAEIRDIENGDSSGLIFVKMGGFR